MKILIVMQGIPGSGKSTVAEAQRFHGDSAVILSTDDYRFDDSGIYVFDPEDNKRYHTMNQKACIEAMQAGVEHIIIDNTNITQWQAAPYFMLARIFEYQVEVCRVECDVEVAIERQLTRPEHRRVPAHVIRSMASQMEELNPAV